MRGNIVRTPSGGFAKVLDAFPTVLMVRDVDTGKVSYPLKSQCKIVLFLNLENGKRS